MIQEAAGLLPKEEQEAQVLGFKIKGNRRVAAPSTGKPALKKGRPAVSPSDSPP